MGTVLDFVTSALFSLPAAFWHPHLTIAWVTYGKRPANKKEISASGVR
jgi:hypothetical protein